MPRRQLLLSSSFDLSFPLSYFIPQLCPSAQLGMVNCSATPVLSSRDFLSAKSFKKFLLLTALSSITTIAVLSVLGLPIDKHLFVTKH